MKSLLIVYHSQSGTCAALARAAKSGAAKEPGVDTKVLRAWDAGARDLLAADALMLIAAENSGHLAGSAKDFLDRSFYPCIERGVNLPYALVVSAGNDGRGALAQAERIFSGYPFKRVAESVILRGEVTDAALEQCKDLGLALAAGLEMGIY